MGERKRIHPGRGGDGLYKKRGIWYFKVRDWNGVYRALSSRTTVYEEAKQRRREYLEDLERGARPAFAPKSTFAVAADEWMARCEVNLAPETLRCYKSRLERVNAVIGEMIVGQITGDTVRRYQMRRAHEITASSVNSEVKVIAAVLKHARQWGRIKDDFRFMRESRTRARVVRKEEWDKLSSVAAERVDTSVMYHVLRVFRETGLRHKEQRTLRLGDVDLDNRCIYIGRAGTKTDAGERIVPLTVDGANALRELLEIARKQGAVHPTHYLFPSTEFKERNGKVRRVPNPEKPRGSFKDAWTTLRRLAEVDETLRLHDFRHTVATDLGEAGVPSGVAMGLMGWKSAGMRQRYEHFQTEALRREIDRVEAHRRASVSAPTLRAAKVISFPRSPSRPSAG